MGSKQAASYGENIMMRKLWGIGGTVADYTIGTAIVLVHFVVSGRDQGREESRARSLPGRTGA